jgi:hypothetical protein
LIALRIASALPSCRTLTVPDEISIFTSAPGWTAWMADVIRFAQAPQWISWTLKVACIVRAPVLSLCRLGTAPMAMALQNNGRGSNDWKVNTYSRFGVLR